MSRIFFFKKRYKFFLKNTNLSMLNKKFNYLIKKYEKSSDSFLRYRYINRKMGKFVFFYGKNYKKFFKNR